LPVTQPADSRQIRRHPPDDEWPVISMLLFDVRENHDPAAGELVLDAQLGRVIIICGLERVPL
jgi:hypothetical protein